MGSLTYRVKVDNPADTKHLYNSCTMLDQRRRCWSDVVQMLYKCFVFAGIMSFFICTFSYNHFDNQHRPEAREISTGLADKLHQAMRNEFFIIISCTLYNLFDINYIIINLM